jgi:metal-responsive CopG/Arc/MetJ family transcriptional regulator
MAKQKTSINIDPELWKEWTLFVVKKTGSTRKLSEEVEKAIREYMERHKKDF